MSRLCSQRVLQGLLRRHIGINHHRLTTTTTTHHFSNSIAANGNGIFSNSCIFSLLRSPSKLYSSSSTTTRLPYTIPKGLGGHGIGAVRFRSTKLPKPGGGFGKKLFDKPAAAVSSAFSRYSEAVGLQIEAFFKRNSLFLYGAAGVLVCALLWKMMYGIASAFIGFSEGMAKYGFLALSSAIVAFAYDMKLLAVDVPMASGPDQRLYLIGDEEEYRVGGGLVAELRDPVVKAMAATKEFDYLDEVEEKEDAERSRLEAERKEREEIEKLENSGNR
ncbi:uncharacterized protein DS421_10g302450 [Arachis hypogaea]|nr:uncharacterized protein DS421_10g302450 [Arachis hypogaea]